MRTKHILLLTPLLLFAMVSVKGQNNLIQNPSVQDPTGDYTPFYRAMVDKRKIKVSDCNSITTIATHDGLDEWEGRFKEKTINFTSPVTGTTCKTLITLHSPDWYMTNSNGSDAKYRFYEDGVELTPHSGIGYMGMRPGELVQQKFPNSNDFEEGESYTLNFYIRTISSANSYADSELTGWQSDWGQDWSDGLDLKVYLRKSKMKYSAAANNKNNRCDVTKYYKKVSMINTITILDHPVTLAAYPTGQWYPVTVEFTAPASSYDWIVIETQSVDLCNSNEDARDPYILLDDFTLTKTCLFPSCDRTGGEVFPHHNGYVTYTAPLTVTNLNNAQSVTLEVYPVGGQSPIWSYSVSCTNGIQDPIYWDGRTTGGSYAANATYILKTTYTNDCGTNSKSSAFIKNGDYSPIITNNIICNTSGVETPIPCCVYEPDLVIDYVTLPGPGLLDYRVINKIDVAPVGTVNVTSNGEVEMRAGYEINLNPGFTTDPGAYYLAEIVPCSNSGRIRPSNVDPVLLSMEKEESIVVAPSSKGDVVTDIVDEENGGKELSVKVFPNPSSTGMFDIQPVNHSATTYIEVLNLMGTVVYTSKLGASNNLRIDISDQAKGIYLVRIVDGEQSLVKKIIYH